MAMMALPDETHLFLIRHGHSMAQQEERMSAAHGLCSGLSDLGRQQVAALARRLADTNELGQVDALFTSLFTRAIETCELLSSVLPGPYTSECGWCETHPGEAEGMSWSEVDERFPRRGDPDPFERRIPGGESWAEFYARAGDRLRRVPLEHPGQRVVVVTHGGIVGASFVALGEVPISKSFSFTATTDNTSITEWCHSAQGWQLVRFNDVAHLAHLR
jgi:2,3-bisphosphoglycerate-dependent phosphoglycerate mutase